MTNEPVWRAFSDDQIFRFDRFQTNIWLLTRICGCRRFDDIQLKKGGEVFSEWLVGGLCYFRQLRNGGPPGSPFRRSGENSGGGRPHPSVTVWNDQTGSLGIEEKISPPFLNIHFQSWTWIRGQIQPEKTHGFQPVLLFHITYKSTDSCEEPEGELIWKK